MTQYRWHLKEYYILGLQHLGNIQETFRELSVNIQRTIREHSGDIQGYSKSP
jgi:hypothetical protein